MLSLFLEEKVQLQLSCVFNVPFYRLFLRVRVNYDKIIEELYNEHISDDKDIDTYIKKLIGNVNFGLLEKSYNKSVCSNIYDSLEEATLYQSKLGGVVHTLQQYTEEERNGNLRPDWMRELDNNLTDEQFEEQKQMNISKVKYIEKGKPLYVLNLTAKKLLVNGFRYIKELLMQHHNFFINCRNFYIYF